MAPRRQPNPQPSSLAQPLPASLVANIRPPQPLNVHGDRAEEWNLFEQQFAWYSAATSLTSQPENIQIAVFMSTLGSDAVKEFNSLKLPLEDSRSLPAILDALRNRFSPKSNFRFERYLFNKLVQDQDEKFDTFLTRVMTRAKKCEFGQLLDDLVIDRIIFGVRDEALRTKLLDTDALSLVKITKLCRNAEACKEQSQIVSSDYQNKLAAASSVAAVKSSPAPATNSQAPSFDCRNCGQTHSYRQCPAFGKTCSYCSKKNHYASFCRAKQQTKRLPVNPARNPASTSSQNSQQSTRSTADRASKKVAEVNVEDTSDVTDDELFVNSVRCDPGCSLPDVLYVNTISVLSVNQISQEKDDDWFEVFECANVKIKLKLDTGAQCNVLPIKLVNRLKLAISPSPVRRIASYSDESFKLPVLGEVCVPSVFRSRPNKLFKILFLVVEENVAPILGRKSCVACDFVRRVHSVSAQSWQDIKTLFSSLFSGLGFAPAFPYDIVLVENPKLSIYPARRIPYQLMAPVKKELDLMEKLQVIKPVSEPTPAVSPMVVIKKGGKIKIGIDPSDLNKNLKRHHHPLKTVEQIAATVAGSKFFTVLDCFKGYWQIPFTERTQKFLTFSTPWGRYSCLRLPYGIASAPEIFQKTMSSLFQDMRNVEISMDDILIHAPTEAELKQQTCAVLNKLQETGFRLNPQKCIFGAQKVKFLGHIFTAAGLLPDQSKIEGILALKTPSGVQELQRFLGSVTYLGKFIPNLSELTDPLRKLLKKEVLWDWAEEHQKAFETLKHVLTSRPVLQFFDVNKPVVLSVDASSRALGAVLLQDNHPVAYATKALSDSQTYLPQIEKEALAVRFACQKFHDYIYGKHLVIESDHKPLETIFKKPIFKAPPRLKRILLDVAIYRPTVLYKKGKDIPIPDMLSRDCNNQPPVQSDELEVLLVLPLSDTATERFIKATELDPDLQTLADTIRKGWPDKITAVQQQIRPYFNFREELALHDGLIIKADQLLVPTSLRPEMLRLIHQGHLGIDSSIKRAKEALYWPNMQSAITSFVNACSVCQSTQRNKPAEPLLLKEVPSRPWQIVASDLFQLGQKQYLLIVDSYSGFVDVAELKSTSSATIIEKLKAWFSVHGIPDKFDSDGGPQYTSTEFRQFATAWKFSHRVSSPHYPQSNGLAERNVATVKNILRKCQLDKTDPYLALLNWRNTPRAKGLPSPNERLMSRKTKTLLPTLPSSLLPKIPSAVPESLEAARLKQKSYADAAASEQKEFSPGDSVMIRMGHRTWVPGKILAKLPEPRSYQVITNTGQSLRQNSSFLKGTVVPFQQQQPLQDAHQDSQPASIPTRPKRIIRPPQCLNL